MKKKLLIISIVLLILLGISIIDTYGLFETTSNGDTSFEVGKWQILLNNTDISIESDITLSSFIYTSDSHTEAGYISPGGSAKLDVIINGTNASTAFEYSISIDDSAIEEFPNLTLSVKNKDTGVVIDRTNYTGQMLLNDTKMINLEVSLEWVDDEAYDESDVKVLDNDISFPISMHFSQLKEE